MAVNKRLHALGLGGFANRIGHVNREEVRWRDETIHRFEPDVVGVHVIRLLPAEFPDCRIRGGAGAGRFGTDDGVLAVGLIPDRNDIHALFCGHHACGQLGPALMCKTVTHAK